MATFLEAIEAVDAALVRLNTNLDQAEGGVVRIGSGAGGNDSSSFAGPIPNRGRTSSLAILNKLADALASGGGGVRNRMQGGT